MTQNPMTRWDAIVIGTGMGGATLGYALAAAGKKVLFLEKGLSPLRAAAVTGDYAERFFPAKRTSHAEQQATLKRAGRAWETLWDISAKKAKPIVPFIGVGAGGSSSLYGGVLERFDPTDFEPG